MIDDFQLVVNISGFRRVNRSCKRQWAASFWRLRNDDCVGTTAGFGRARLSMGRTRGDEMRQTIISLTLAILLLGAGNIRAQRSEMNGIQWTLTYANGRAVTSSLAYFEINASGTRFTGSTACNRMFGTVQVTSGKISFSAIGTTKMVCKLSPGSVPENIFLEALEKAARYTRNGNNLHVFDKRGRMILRFRRSVKHAPIVENGPVPKLGAAKWELESIKKRKTFAPIRGAFINFDPVRNSAGGNGGCNVFGGRYSASGSKIAIRDIVSTMRACIDDGSMDTEREFLNGLRAANEFEIRDGRLFLYRGKELLLTLRGEPKE